jgi:nitrile hydratase
MGGLEDGPVAIEEHASEPWENSIDATMVLPMRPAGTEEMNEEALADLVTRDCMIGVTVPKGPETV